MRSELLPQVLNRSCVDFLGMERKEIPEICVKATERSFGEGFLLHYKYRIDVVFLYTIFTTPNDAA